MTDSSMKLRYTGTCRVCGAPLPAGTTAVYERSRRTVRCLGCGDATGEADSGPTGPQSDPVSSEPPSPELDATASVHPPRNTDALRLRAPGSAVIAEALRAQASRDPRSRVARFFGADPLSAEAAPWYRGALGELEVGRVLDRLGPAWIVVHAVPVGTAGSDIDHLLVGPGGVFTINAKNHTGRRVWVGARRLLVDGQRTDHLRNAAFEARRVAQLLSRAARASVAVTPIVAIVGARAITVKERPADVVVLSAHSLVRWLNRRAVILTEAEVAAISRCAVDPATWASPVLADADLAGFASLREEVASARRRRVGWGLAGMLGFVLLAVSLASSFVQSALAALLS